MQKTHEMSGPRSAFDYPRHASRGDVTGLFPLAARAAGRSGSPLIAPSVAAPLRKASLRSQTPAVVSERHREQAESCPLRSPQFVSCVSDRPSLPKMASAMPPHNSGAAGIVLRHEPARGPPSRTVPVSDSSFYASPLAHGEVDGELSAWPRIWIIITNKDRDDA